MDVGGQCDLVECQKPRLRRVSGILIYEMSFSDSVSAENVGFRRSQGGVPVFERFLVPLDVVYPKRQGTDDGQADRRRVSALFPGFGFA